MRGGENVLAEFCDLFPKADIYTHACRPDQLDSRISLHPIHESFIGRFPGARRNCQKYLPLMPWALKRLQLESYDLLISSESGPAKGVRKRPDAVHICYCHTPMRYLWDMHDEYYQRAGVGGKIAMKLWTDYLRNYDLKSAESVDHFLANSNFVAERIRRIYGRESEVIYPPVDVDFFSAASPPEKRDYYLFVGQLIGYKRPDLAIAACRKLHRKLIVIGDGPMRRDLETMAGDDGLIEFVGRCDRSRMRELYAGARALIFPGVEDFGIVPLEAQATGTPVIALGHGGALETVWQGETGLFFAAPEVPFLLAAMEEFEARQWDSEKAREQAKKFNPERFRSEIRAFIQSRLP